MDWDDQMDLFGYDEPYTGKVLDKKFWKLAGLIALIAFIGWGLVCLN